MRPAWLLALPLLLLPGIPVAAVNPLDDDAGSGGDAGDVPDLAVAPGALAFAGRLSKPHDLWDWYAIQGSEGQVLRIDLRANGWASAFLQGPGGSVDSYGAAGTGESVDILLLHDGPWYIMVAAPFYVPEPSLEVIDYEVHLTYRTPTDAAWVLGAHAARSAEFAWVEPSAAVVTARISFPLELSTPAQALFLAEWTTPEVQFWAAGYAQFGGGGAGTSIQVVPPGRPPLHAPSLTVDLQNGVARMELSGPGLLSVRVTFHATTLPLDSSIAAFSGDRFERRFSTDVAAFTWTERNAGAALQVAVPGASATAPRELALGLGPRHFAFLDTAGFQGSITDPAGNTQSYGFFEPIAFVVRPQTGTWRFNLGATVGWGAEAERVYLHVLEAPSLGLFRGL